VKPFPRQMKFTLGACLLAVVLLAVMYCYRLIDGLFSLSGIVALAFFSLVIVLWHESLPEIRVPVLDAACSGDFEKVLALLREKPELIERHGKTLLELAQALGHEKTVALLKASMAAGKDRYACE